MSLERTDGHCWPKTGWATGETYCGFHGRDCGWPCAADAVPARLRAAAAAAQEALDTYFTEPAELDQAAAWEPAVSALIDLADVLEAPRDRVARVITRALAVSPLPSDTPNDRRTA